MAQDVVFVTGMSGAGKSTALKMLEDMGYFCVDNLPVALIGKFAALVSDDVDSKVNRIAIGVDIRSGKTDLGPLQEALDDLKKQGFGYRVLFLEADDAVLVKRYKESRRSHPLAADGRIGAGIAAERGKLAFLRKEADYIVDTSKLLTRDLRTELERIFIQEQKFRSLMVTILSFGFKYGIPTDADLVFDVRFLPNPFYVPELKTLTGLDAPVRDFVMSYEMTETFLDKLTDMIRFLIPHYIEEGKTSVVIAVGCTGGRHRSVTLAEALYARLGSPEGYGLSIEHRDIAH